MTKRYLLDTDTCSYVIRNRPESARRRMNAVPLEQQGISVITYAELLYGVRRSSNKRVNRRVVDAFVRHLSVLEWTREAAECYAEVRTTLEHKDKPIGAMDC
ncbi:MAG: type II toxin-antitoxin system VapC family toxin [Gammaproteobacteria bacterium]